MGNARVLATVQTGRFTVEIDTGEAARLDMVAAVARLLVILDGRITAQQLNVDAADAREAVIIADLKTWTEVITQLTQEGKYGQASLAAKFYSGTLIPLLVKEQARNRPVRIALRKLQDARAEALRRAALWNNADTLARRDIWCCTYSDPAGEYVGTLEINGESDLILAAPLGRIPNNATDGYLWSRELMSPEQVYFNAAILPGWQRDKPTYRWGTITSIDSEANTANVSLAPAKSSAQRLNINKQQAIVDVPVTYMTCDCKAFKVNDRVVVQLEGQSWDTPKLIGFLDNPRPCPPLQTYLIEVWNYSPSNEVLFPKAEAPIGPLTMTQQYVHVGEDGEPVAAQVGGLGTFFLGWWRTIGQTPITVDTILQHTNITAVNTWKATYAYFNQLTGLFTTSAVSGVGRPTDYYANIQFTAFTSAGSQAGSGVYTAIWSLDGLSYEMNGQWLVAGPFGSLAEALAFRWPRVTATLTIKSNHPIWGPWHEAYVHCAWDLISDGGGANGVNHTYELVSQDVYAYPV